MDWADKTQVIYSILKETGNTEVIKQMVDEYGIGGTSGEQFSIVCTWLAKMRNHHSAIYALIKEHADCVLQVGIDSNYFTNDYYNKQ